MQSAKPILSKPRLTTSQQVKATVAQALLTALDSGCSSYCVLSGYEGLPQSFDTDIDFMVAAEDFERIPKLMSRVAIETDSRVLQVVEHEVSGRAYWLASTACPELTTVQLDCASDYRHFGLLWLRAKEVLASRRWHPNGFWVPAAAHEFAYYLIKRINKRSFGDEHGARLHKLYAEDPAGCDQMIARFWKDTDAAMLSRAASSGDWSGTVARLDHLRRQMREHSAESPAARVASLPEHARSLLRRIAQPTGGWIAVMGPDGAGKSLVINSVFAQLTPVFRNIRRYHLRPKVLRSSVDTGAPVTDPHGQRPRGYFASIAKVFYFLAEYWAGYLLEILPAMMRSDFIIFDRYIYDLLVDSRRVRYGGPAWLLRLAARLVPKPDLVVLLDAAPEVLWSRKQEVTFDEVVRQHSAYLKVAESLPSVAVVDASQPPAEVVRDVCSAIVDIYASRTARRFHLRGNAPNHAQMTTEAQGHKC